MRKWMLETNGYSNVTGLHVRYAIEVDDYEEKEKMLHKLFAGQRVGSSEFFALNVDLVVELLESMDGRQIYPETEPTSNKVVKTGADNNLMDMINVLEETEPCGPVVHDVSIHEGKLLHEFTSKVSSVYVWINAVGHTEETIDGCIVSELVDGYNKWCRINNRQPLTRMEFMRQIHNKFPGLQRGSKQVRLPLYMANLKGYYRTNPDAYPRVSVINRAGSQAVKFVGEYGEFNPGYVYRMANGEPSTSDSTHNADTNTTEPNN